MIHKTIISTLYDKRNTINRAREIGGSLWRIGAFCAFLCLFAALYAVVFGLLLGSEL